MNREPIDLDVDTPGAVADVLRRAAQQYHESAGELEAAWQDPAPRKLWTAIALVLERAAAQVDKVIERHG